MMNAALNTIIARDRYYRILTCLTPKQLSVVALRLDGLTQAEIARLLGLERSHIYSRLEGAKRRLEVKMPELPPETRNRQRRKRIC